jgi:hypothetical protein
MTLVLLLSKWWQADNVIRYKNITQKRVQKSSLKIITIVRTPVPSLHRDLMCDLKYGHIWVCGPTSFLCYRPMLTGAIVKAL